MAESNIFVEENDMPIGVGTREEAWAKGIHVRIVRGDTYESAIRRELEGELGLETELTFLGKFASIDITDDKTILEFNTVYEGKIGSSVSLNIQESEVSDTRWYEPSELKRLMQDDPNSFTPGFRELITRYYNV